MSHKFITWCHTAQRSTLSVSLSVFAVCSVSHISNPQYTMSQMPEMREAPYGIPFARRRLTPSQMTQFCDACRGCMFRAFLRCLRVFASPLTLRIEVGPTMRTKPYCNRKRAATFYGVFACGWLARDSVRAQRSSAADGLHVHLENTNLDTSAHDRDLLPQHSFLI